MDADMSSMRPGQKVRFWAPKFLNEPDVAAPGLLRILASIGMLSVAGVPFYAAILAVSGTSVDNAQAVYVAVVHFVLPLGLFYAVNANSPLSRWVVAIYFITLCTATFLGKGFLGRISSNPILPQGIAVGVLILVLLWLFASPKIRVYYALVRGKEIPQRLKGRRDELTTTDWLGPRGKAMLSNFLDNMETIVMIGFILAVLAAVFWR